MKDKCKCHGVSGSCSMKTCWKKLSDFNATATLLRQKYNQAIRKAPNARTMRREASSSRVKKPIQRRKKVNHELAFNFEKSYLLSLYLYLSLSPSLSPCFSNNLSIQRYTIWRHHPLIVPLQRIANV